MKTEELRFRIHRTSQLTQILNGREFETEKDFLELLEDYLFGKIIASSDIGDYVSEEEVFGELMTKV